MKKIITIFSFCIACLLSIQIISAVDYAQDPEYKEPENNTTQTNPNAGLTPSTPVTSLDGKYIETQLKSSSEVKVYGTTSVLLDESALHVLKENSSAKLTIMLDQVTVSLMGSDVMMDKPVKIGFEFAPTSSTFELTPMDKENFIPMEIALKKDSLPSELVIELTEVRFFPLAVLSIQENYEWDFGTQERNYTFNNGSFISLSANESVGEVISSSWLEDGTLSFKMEKFGKYIIQNADTSPVIQPEEPKETPLETDICMLDDSHYFIIGGAILLFIIRTLYSVQSIYIDGIGVIVLVLVAVVFKCLFILIPISGYILGILFNKWIKKKPLK